MISPERRKKDILENIAINPTTICIKQTRKVVINGAYDEVESEIIFEARIFAQKNPDLKVSSDTKGTAYSSKTYGMLVDSGVELSVSTKERIEFNCPYGKMRIIEVYPQIVKGVLCGYQCDLERID
jgi:hypothetical protein